MSYELDNLRELPRGVVTDAAVRDIIFGVTAADSKTFTFGIKVSAVSGAGPTYANMTLFTSYDGGVSWQSVSNTTAEPITGTGVFRIYPTSNSSPVSPLVKVVITCVAGHTVTLGDIFRTKVAPGDSTFPAASSGASVAVTGPLGSQLEADSVAVTLADDEGIRGVSPTGTNPEMLVETTGELRVAGLVPEKWEGLTVTYVSPTQETYEYFEDAAKTTLICTITVDYTDATKENLSSVVRT